MTTPPGFIAYPKIERFKGLHVRITEKVHGTNALLAITTDGELYTGKRTGWCTPEVDNYGFASWAHANKEALVTLGTGMHYGEWYGPGINSGYGLKEKRLALFNTVWFGKRPSLPDRVDVVPILYDGPYYDGVVGEHMHHLKTNGSVIAPGFMRPEGVVVEFPLFGTRRKVVFEAEETGWRGGDPNNPPKSERLRQFVATEAYAQYLQPIRLEKLLSRDEAYVRDFPSNIVTLVDDYLKDLQEETGELGDHLKAVRTGVFPWVKLMITSAQKQE
jgi:hypothetical protein